MLGDAVFDLDGTLVDSAIECAAITNLMRVDRGLSPLTVEVARRCSSLGGRRMVAILLGECAGAPDADLIEFRARYLETVTPESSLYPDVLATLRGPRSAGVRLSVCSAKPQALCEKVVVETGLSAVFAAVVGSCPTLPCKPDPDHLHRILAMVGGRCDRACLIGDSEVDHALAVNAEVPLIMVSHGYAAEGFDTSGLTVAETFAGVGELVVGALGAGAAH